MEEDIKPDVTDSTIEENQVAEAIDDLFEEGDPNDVEAAEKPGITLERLEELSGRKFDSIEDAEKHYTNLKNFVGKKTGEVAKQPDNSGTDLDGKIQAGIKAALEEQSLSSNKESKDYLDLVKAVAKDKGISLSEAWEKHVKDTAIAASEYKKGRDVGVNSKTRINPMVSQKMKELEDSARQGSPEAKDDLVAKHLEAIGLK
jgi:hypothetical protein